MSQWNASSILLNSFEQSTELTFNKGIGYTTYGKTSDYAGDSSDRMFNYFMEKLRAENNVENPDWWGGAIIN